MFLSEDFLKITVMRGELFEILWFFFCLKIGFNVNGKATVWHTSCFIFVVKNHQMVTLIQILDVKTSKEILSVVGGVRTRCKISQSIFQKMLYLTCFNSFFEMPHLIFNCYFSRLWANYLFIFEFDENGQIFMSCNALGPGHYPTQNFPFLKNKLSKFGVFFWGEGGAVSPLVHLLATVLMIMYKTVAN